MKIISMVPSLTETFIECGINVVGRTRFCVHPESAVKSIEAVGGTKDIDWHKVKKLKPDFLILDQEENPKSMADESPVPYLCTHVRSIDDIHRDLKMLSKKLHNQKLAGLAERWARVSAMPNLKLTMADIPVMEWIKKSENLPEQFIYLIWYKPWMAVSRGTFIGSVFRKLGLSQVMVDFEKPYPEVDLSHYDTSKTCLLFSSEPFPFAKKKVQLLDLPFSSALVDGQLYSWFGVRSLRFLETALGIQPKL